MRSYYTKSTQKIIKQKANEVINLLKYKYNADILGIGDFISKRKPEDWKRLEKNWDDEFKKIEIIVVPDVRVRRSGTIY